MGKEPRHFMAMFGGKMLVYEGGTGRSTVQYGVHNWWNRNIHIRFYHVSNCFLLHKMLNLLKSYQGPSQLFQVRGVDEVSTKAFEVMPVSVKELDNFYALLIFLGFIKLIYYY